MKYCVCIIIIITFSWFSHHLVVVYVGEVGHWLDIIVLHRWCWLWWVGLGSLGCRMYKYSRARKFKRLCFVDYICWNWKFLLPLPDKWGSTLWWGFYLSLLLLKLSSVVMVLSCWVVQSHVYLVIIISDWYHSLQVRVGLSASGRRSPAQLLLVQGWVSADSGDDPGGSGTGSGLGQRTQSVGLPGPCSSSWGLLSLRSQQYPG